MSLSADLDKKLNEYTKEDLIAGIKQIDYKGYVLTKLPLIKYNRICDEAEKMSKKAREYAAWKHRMIRQWNKIELVDLQLPDSEYQKLKMEEEFTIKLTLHTKDIDPEHMGAEIIVAMKENDVISDLHKVFPMETSNYSHHKQTFEAKIHPFSAGVYNFSIRIFPKHPLVPHRMDFPLFKWI